MSDIELVGPAGRVMVPEEDAKAKLASGVYVTLEEYCKPKRGVEKKPAPKRPTLVEDE